jgi:hypothetical protein
MAPRHLLSLLALAPFALLAAGCGAADPTAGDEQDTTATVYVDATTFLTTQADKDAWSGLITRMTGEFNDVCGDTFCGGDYPNLRPLDLTCAVTSKVGQIHDCLWTFAGSEELVNGTTGALTVSKPSFQCHFKTTARVPAFITAMTQDDGEDQSIRRILPGNTVSIYDGLVDCFQHPIGATPVTFVHLQDPPYSSVGDAPITNGSWWSAERAYEKAFSAACPGSFCTGEYDNFEALRLTCAVSTKTGNIKSCATIVAGSKPAVNPTKGTVSTEFTSYRCSVPMKGTPNDLSAMILADTPTPMLDRALPGSTKTLRQALTTCL